MVDETVTLCFEDNAMNGRRSSMLLWNEMVKQASTAVLYFPFVTSWIESRGGWKEVESRVDRSISTIKFAKSAKFFVSSQQFSQCAL